MPTTSTLYESLEVTVSLALEQEYLLPYGLGCLLAHIILFITFKYIIPFDGPWRQMPSFTAHQTIAFVLMIQWSYYGILHFSPSQADAFSPFPPGMMLAQCTTGALFLWDIPVFLFSDGMNDNAVMHAHHLGMFLVAATVLGFFSSDQDSTPIGPTYAPFFFGIVEISSIPLQIVDLFHPKQTHWHSFHNQHPPLQQLNEVSRILFALLFLVVRGIVFPYVVVTGIAPDFLKGAQEQPALAPPLYGLLVLAVAFTLLQLYWAGLVLRQVQKALTGGGGEEEKTVKKED